LLMASNTSYHKRLHGPRRFAYHILTLFTACRCLAVLAHDLGVREQHLALFHVIDLICCGESLFIKDLT
jgi:hypothetical protein